MDMLFGLSASLPQPCSNRSLEFASSFTFLLLASHGASYLQVSWNIDCLNPANRFARVDEVCAILLEAEEKSLPDVILLQVWVNTVLPPHATTNVLSK